MNELRRILDDEPDQTMRALLDAARSDAPPDDAARSRTLLALGVGATTGAALTAGAVKLGASPGGPLAKVLSPLVLKWLVPLGLSATLGLGAVGYVEHRHAASAASRLAGQERGAVEQAAATAAAVASKAASPGRAAAPVAPSSVALDEAPAPAAEPLAPVVATVPATVSAAAPVAAPTVSPLQASQPTATASAPTPPPTTPTPARTTLAAPMTTAAAAASGSAEHDAALAAEVQRLDQVQAALTQHRPRAALGLLGTYTREFPRGSLAPEATLMRIDALLLAGDRPAAEALAASFVAARSGAPYAARVHALLAR